MILKMSTQTRVRTDIIYWKLNFVYVDVSFLIFGSNLKRIYWKIRGLLSNNMELFGLHSASGANRWIFVINLTSSTINCVCGKLFFVCVCGKAFVLSCFTDHILCSAGQTLTVSCDALNASFIFFYWSRILYTLLITLYWLTVGVY